MQMVPILYRPIYIQINQVICSLMPFIFMFSSHLPNGGGGVAAAPIGSYKHVKVGALSFCRFFGSWDPTHQSNCSLILMQHWNVWALTANLTTTVFPIQKNRIRSERPPKYIRPHTHKDVFVYKFCVWMQFKVRMFAKMVQLLVNLEFQCCSANP